MLAMYLGIGNKEQEYEYHMNSTQYHGIVCVFQYSSLPVYMQLSSKYGMLTDFVYSFGEDIIFPKSYSLSSAFCGYSLFDTTTEHLE